MYETTTTQQTKKRKLSAPDQALQGLVVAIDPALELPFLSNRIKIWRSSLAELGGTLVENPHDPSITHLITQFTTAPPSPSPTPTQQQPSHHRVSEDWLVQSLMRKQKLPESQYPPHPAPLSVTTPTKQSNNNPSSTISISDEELPLDNISSSKSTADRQRWLGSDLWHPACATMSLTELALQGIYNEERSRHIGNEPVVQALKELMKYELGQHEAYYTAIDDETNDNKVMNHRALRYAKAASIVRGCAYKLDPTITASQLPFVGQATARQINCIIQRGSCPTLDDYRMNLPVTDSRGKVRLDSVGGKTRAAFVALPAVGARTANKWWELGMRSYADLDLSCEEPDGLLNPENPAAEYPITPEQLFSLQHRTDLLEPTSREEVDEMRRMILQGLQAVSGYTTTTGWRVELVGGGRRSAVSVHDADFLVTHESESIQNLIQPLKDYLVGRSGCVYNPSTTGAMCRIQAGHTINNQHIKKIKEMHLKEQSAAPSRETMDKFDHLYCMYRCIASNKTRRMDVIICPLEEWAFAYLGWVGSKTFLRLQRQHAKDSGMFLNSHGLFVKVEEQGQIVSLQVPHESPPRNREGVLEWPAGWNSERRPVCEEDVFELLQLPYRQPEERNCV